MFSAVQRFGLPADVDWNGHMDLDGWGWVLMTLGMIAFWGLVIFGVVWVVRELGGRPRASVSGAAAEGMTDPDPGAILDRRLAEGDISIEEHRERRRALASPPGASEPGAGSS